MCGISGFFSHKEVSSKHVLIVKKIQVALKHRGPDSSGWFNDNNAILCMNRLSIIDLSGGMQPLYNEDKSIVLVANGEIYNHVELKCLLEKKHAFNTGSDCETIIHLYEDYGVGCLSYLRGMFAFALWDIKQGKLFIARDRMGEKPLYLAETSDGLYFSSELRALVKSGAIVSPELDLTAIIRFLGYQYIPEPYTAIKGIRKLPAGCYITIDRNGFAEKPYWNMLDAPVVTGNPITHIAHQLEEMSSIIMRSDVPIGVALSGGIDSSVIACLAKKNYHGDLHAFTVGYKGYPHTDERDHARQLANFLDIPFHDIELSSQDLLEKFPFLVNATDDPIADIAAFGYYALSECTHNNGVKVLLQGQGGDELFWGYPWVKTAVSENIKRQNLILNGTRPNLLDYVKFALPQRYDNRHILKWVYNFFGLKESINFYAKLKKSLDSPQNILFYELAFLNTNIISEIKNIGGNRLLKSFNEEELYAHSVNNDYSFDLLITDLICKTYLLENGMAQGDRLSMASSVELRLPFVDHRLVETVIGLRKSETDINLPPKYWLREAVKDIVPNFVFQRPKRGFTPPVRAWQNMLFKHYGHLLIDGSLVSHGIINPRTAVAYSKFSTRSFTPNVSLMPYAVLVLEIWCRELGL